MNKVKSKKQGASRELTIGIWFSYITLSIQLVVFCLVLAVPGSANSAVFNVPSGDVVALINAINQANANGEADTINLGGGTYTLTEPNNNIDGPTGLPSITSNITLNGSGTIIERSDQSTDRFRIFHVAASGNLKLNELVVRGGFVPFGQGGGILNDGGTVTIANCSISDNQSSLGGGILNVVGTLTITNSIFSGNISQLGFVGSATSGLGGGIYEQGGTLTITKSTFVNNTGDGISNVHGIATITNSTIRDNLTTPPDFTDAGISNFGGTVTLTNSTISEPFARGILNSGTDEIGIFTVTNSTISASRFGVLTDSGEVGAVTNLNNVTISQNSQGLAFRTFGRVRVNISNTLIAQNPQGDCIIDSLDRGRVDIISQGFNLIGNNQDCDGFVNGVNGDKVGTSANPIDARLTVLVQNNGGPTQTFGMFDDSPAVDAGNPAAPGSGSNACELTDQRGFVRPVDGPDADSIATCDIGAVELGALPPPVVNSFVTFEPITLLAQGAPPFRTTSDSVGCGLNPFEGKFIFSARIAEPNRPNFPSLSDLKVQVTTLTEGEPTTECRWRTGRSRSNIDTTRYVAKPRRKRTRSICYLFEGDKAI